MSRLGGQKGWGMGSETVTLNSFSSPGWTEGGPEESVVQNKVSTATLSSG